MIYRYSSEHFKRFNYFESNYHENQFIMRPHLKSIILFVNIFILSLSSLFSQDINSKIDALINENYPNEGVSISLLVAKNGKTIYKNAAGKANLELDVDATPDNVYELGSITKQFTAVAILMLEEEGKLKVTDDITKYISDYPTQENSITIYQLLNHTSGIQSYTGMQSFMDITRTDMTPSELIDVFKNEPMEFGAGEAYKYNNSGYILLGHIIEVVSGISYEEFIQKNIFDPLGMNNSYYGSKTKLIKGRASGYTEGNGMENGKYLSMSLPYAAGSLMSTVEDMLKWQNALSANKLITKANYDRATNGSKLANGEDISYGFGWIKDDLRGSKMIHHGGGIFGYTTFGIYLPDEDVYVIGLSNCDCGDVTTVTTKVAAIAIEKPIPSIKDAIELSAVQVDKWTGAYEFEEGVIRHITKEEGKLFSQREGSTKLPIYPMSENQYIFEDGMIEYHFTSVDGKKKVAMRRGGEDMIGNEIDKAPPAAKKEISLSKETMEQYIGKYELAPSFHIEVSVTEGKLMAQATGQPAFQLFAENETDFFLKVVQAEIKFTKDDTGDVTMLTLYQGGGVMPGKKIK